MEASPRGSAHTPIKCPSAAEDVDQLRTPSVLSQEFLEFKRKATTIVEEYFSIEDVAATANELRELRVPCYHYYFVKKLVSVAMDRHDREKEMAAVLLSSLYNDVIDRPQVYKGFCKLTESCDDLSVDTPDAVDILAVFVARAIVDDILPLAFLAKQLPCLPDGCKGAEVIHRAEKSYLSVPHHGEIILQRWGGIKNITVEEAKAKIAQILEEYLAAGDTAEAFRCIRGLKIAFFHHDSVKRATVLAIERGGTAEGLILDFLKSASDQGVINVSQIIKGFNRMINSVDDLTLDVPNARCLLKSIILKASSEGWLCASSLKPLGLEPKKAVEDDTAVKKLKAKAVSIIQEYFLTGDIIESVSRLEAENSSCPPLRQCHLRQEAYHRRNGPEEPGERDGLRAAVLALHTTGTRRRGVPPPDRRRRGRRAGQPRHRRRPGHVLRQVSGGRGDRAVGPGEDGGGGRSPQGGKIPRHAGAAKRARPARSKALRRADPSVLGRRRHQQGRVGAERGEGQDRQAAARVRLRRRCPGGVPVHQGARYALLPPRGGEKGAGGDHREAEQGRAALGASRRVLRPWPHHAEPDDQGLREGGRLRRRPRARHAGRQGAAPLLRRACQEGGMA